MTEMMAEVAGQGAPDDREGKYLTFVLSDEVYGIGILKVREIIGMMPITPVPRTPPYVKGVINLRGRVIPVIDLRLKFDLPELEYKDRTSIIVVEVMGQNKNIQLGIVVDSVSEVVNIRAGEIEDAPLFGTQMDTAFILGMAKQGDRVSILLEIDRVLTTEELTVLDRAT